MTPDEVTEYKKQILEEIAQHEIKIYDFPDSDNLKKLKAPVPFAVVGSTEVHEVEGKKVRGRKYPWGLVEVENLEHSDFVALRCMLLRNLLDLKEVTSNVHYENFRSKELARLSADDSKGTTKNQLNIEDHEAKLKKMETDFEQAFEIKVKEKERLIKDSEIVLQQKSKQMFKGLVSEASELAEMRLQLEIEIGNWKSSAGVKN